MIAIVTPNTDTFTNPTMVSLLRYLNGKNENVYLFGPKQEPSCPPEFGFVSHQVTTFKLTLRNPKYWWQQIRSYRKVRKVLGCGGGSTILAVDPLGLIIGGRIKKYLCPKAKLGYLSFEIFFENELTGYYLKLKHLEKKYSPVVDSLLTQDETRRELLFAENGISLPPDKVAIVPVSPDYINVTGKVDIHKQLGLAENIRTVVYSGSVGKWCGTDVILETFERGLWPEGWHLVFHTRRAPEPGSEYCKRLNDLDANPAVPFTLHPHPFGPMSDLAAYLSGFDAALALYYPNNENPYYGRNMQEIGLSSGKFSMYMMLGLPTIVTHCRIYDKLQNEYGFGALASTPEELAEALRSTEFKSGQTRRLYDEVLKPDVREYEKII